MTRNIVLLSGLAVCLGVTGCETRRHEPQNATAMKLPTEPPKRPLGMKALEVKPGATPFSVDDVTQYVRTHRLARMVGDLAQLQVESVEYITAREVTSRLQGVSTGLPDSQRLAFAVIRGPLYISTPTKGKPVAFERGYALFDVATGNLLMSGTLDKAKQGQGKQPQR